MPSRKCKLSCINTTTGNVQDEDIEDWVDVGEGDEFELVEVDNEMDIVIKTSFLP